MIASGVGVLLDHSGVVHLSLAQQLAIPLTVLGLGLLVGGWWGRAWSLIPVAALLVPVVAVAGYLTVPLDGGTGTRVYRAATLAELQPGYHLGVGKLTVDLSKLPLRGDGASLRASVGVGQLVVVVPDGVQVTVDGHAGLGEVDAFRHVDDGSRVDSHVVDGSAAGGRLDLDVAVGIGQVRVDHAGAFPGGVDSNGVPIGEVG
jgi:hypothetical protein